MCIVEKWKPNVNPKTHIAPKRLQNWELGPILGQNGDPDLIELFPTLPAPKVPLKNQKKHEKEKTNEQLHEKNR